MGRYIVFSGAPTLREIRTGVASSAPEWKEIGSGPADTSIGVGTFSGSSIAPFSSNYSPLGVDQDSVGHGYGLPPEGNPSNIFWSQSQNETQSQSQTQQETFFQTSIRIEGQTIRTDSITSTSTTSTLLEGETLPTRTFRMTNTLPDSQQSISSTSSSIANFPTFHFSLRSIMPLRVALTPVGRGSVRANLLVAVMEVDGPDMITTKAGQDTHLLKLVVGDEGAVGKVTVWGDTALEWGGAKKMMGLRRGDVAYLSDVQVTSHPPDPPTLSASPRQNSGIQLCYRTIVRTDQDKRLQPDLRLGQTDACVRRVAAFVEWAERVI